MAIARVVIRSKESLVAIRPIGDALGMATMIFADEVTSPERLEEVSETTEVKTTKRELEIAIQLVESLAAEFEPEKYHDTYRKEVLDLIERKAQGEEIAVQPAPEEVAAPAPDLMSALKASLDAVRARDDDEVADGREAAAANRRAKRPRRRPPPNRAPKKPRRPGASRRGQACREGTRGNEGRGQEAPARQGAPARGKPGEGRGQEAARDLLARNGTSPPRPSRRPADSGARRRSASPLRDPGASRPAPALGPAPGARRRARQLGAPEGPAGGARGQPLRGRHRGPPDRVPRLRGRDPARPVRGGADDRVGQRARTSA